MMKLYFAPGACSFVAHVALELVKASGGPDFEPVLVKLHKGEHRSAEYLATNPDGQVPVLIVDGQPLTQIVAICDYLDRRFPDAGLLPSGLMPRAQAFSQLAWMNNTVHPTFTHIFRPENFVESDAAKAESRRIATAAFRGYLSRIQGWTANASPFWHGARLGVHDAYAFTLLRWGGLAGINPDDFPSYRAYVGRVMAAAPVATALERERIRLDTYKAA